MTWLLLLGSADPTGAAPSWLDSLGPFLPFGALSLLVIIWQARKIDAKDKQIEAANAVALDLARKLLPAITESTQVLRQVAEHRERGA